MRVRTQAWYACFPKAYQRRDRGGNSPHSMLGGESDSSSRELARYIADVGRSYDAGVKPLLVFRLDRFLRGGDHYSFNQQGFAAVRFTEFREDFNHQHQNVRTENGIEYGDLPKFVNFDYVANVARLNAATLGSLASAPAPPANVKILTKTWKTTRRLHGIPRRGRPLMRSFGARPARPTGSTSKR